MRRRRFMRSLLSGLALIAFAPALRSVKSFAADAVARLAKSDAAWKQQLTPAQYDVLRAEGTERAFTSPLLTEHRDGAFACIACDLPLFSSKAKFESGTGWPSFFESVPDHVETKSDYKLLMQRTEYHCARCGGHQGHVFNDGPQPTGLRYCNNGVALKFVPQGS